MLITIASTGYGIESKKLWMCYWGTAVYASSIQTATKLFEIFSSFVSKNSYLMQFHEINFCQIMIFELDTVYGKNWMLKMSNQSREKSQVFSQVVE